MNGAHRLRLLLAMVVVAAFLTPVAAAASAAAAPVRVTRPVPAAAAAPVRVTRPVPVARGPWAQRVRFAQRQRRAERLLARLRGRPGKPIHHKHHKKPRFGGQPPATCPSSLNTFAQFGQFPSLPEHHVELLTRPSGQPYFLGAGVYGPGSAVTTNCASVNLEQSVVRSGAQADWVMYTGPHSVVQANVYGSSARTGTPTWTAYYPTRQSGDNRGYDQNPLFDTAGPGTTFGQAFVAGTGELVVWDSLDWLTSTGGCQGCDLSGYTIDSMSLGTAAGGLPGVDAHGAVFRNVTFGPGYPLDASDLEGAVFQNVTFGAGANLAGVDLKNAVFDNVTMPAPVLTGANLSGATFVGTNTITSPALAGADLDAITLSAGTSITNSSIGKSSTRCTTAENADLSVGRFTVSAVSACPTTTTFAGSQVRPDAVPLARWTAVNWSGAVLVFEASTASYLAGAELAGLMMPNAQLWGVPANFTGTDLTRATLNGTSFTNAIMTNAVLEGASAVRASFAGVNFTGAKLDEPSGMTTEFDNASFIRTTLDNATFNGSFIRGANFTRASAHGLTDFGNTKASAAIFDRAHVLGNPSAFAGAVFDPSDGFKTDASFVNAVLGGSPNTSTGINFAGVHLDNAHFNGAQCIGCVFTAGAELENANFADAFLQGASFSGVTLSGANFAGAQLSDTDGTWKFALGLAESAKGAYAVKYGPTSFVGSSTTDVSTCPNSTPPDPTIGCANKTSASPLTATCSAAGEDACPTVVTTAVGTGTAGSGPTQVGQPQAVVTAPNGDVYFADAANHVVRKIVNGGKAVTIAGDGTDGDSGDGGDALQASLGTPTGLALAADGTTLYVSDIEANRIRKITQVTDSSGVTSYQIYAVAGSGEWCDNPPSGCGDGTNPLAARFAGPAAIWVDPVQNVYIADTGDNTVRVVIAGGGVTTIGAGDLQEPSGITGDGRGNVFVSDTDGARVLKIAPSGTVTTVLGTGVPGYNGTYTSDPVSHQPTQPKLGTTAEIDSPRGLATNLAGQLFVAEAGNGIVRRLDPSGYISLTAGKTINGDTATDTSFTADGQYANATGFKSPVAVAVTSDGQFAVSDAGYLRVREFGPYPFS